MLRCADDSYYVGQTDDLASRVAAHQSGLIEGYTQKRRPVTLAWSQEFAERDEAFRAERQIKGWSRAKKEALIRGDWDAIHLLAMRTPVLRDAASTSSAVPQDERKRIAQTEPAQPEEGLSKRSASKAHLEGPVVRVDDGVADGGEVSMFYDPMIAKLITWAPTREAAIDAQTQALDQFVIDGISDNVDFLSALMQHPRFRSADITTGFIAEEYPDGFEGAPADDQLIEDLTAIAGMVAVTMDERASEISDQLGERPKFPGERIVKVDGGPTHRVRIKPYQGGTVAVTDDGDLVDIVGRWTPGQRLLTVVIDGRLRTVQVRRVGRNWELQTRGAIHKVQVLNPHVAELSKHMIEKPAPDLSRLLLAPMPGLLTKLDVAIGDKVEPGQQVAVMEAMKMENILRAPKAATVKATPAKAGDSLAVDQVIVEFE
jgi:propionyl-CoA carboxylase alpha chain